MDYNTALTSKYTLSNVNVLYRILSWLRESFGKHISPLPQSLSPFLRYYRGRYRHPRGITTTLIPITAVNTAVTAVLPQSPSPCQSLVQNPHHWVKTSCSVLLVKPLLATAIAA